MIRASALYISVWVSLAIVVLCGTLIMGAMVYRMQQKQQERHLRLENNVLSGINILLNADFPADTALSMGLFVVDGVATDSVYLIRSSWGVYDVGKVSSQIHADTLRKTFLMAPAPEDSLMVLYVSDEDRPLSISGKSLLRGTAYLPKSGIRSAYVNGAGYADKTLVHGKTKDSGRDLPALNALGLQRLRELINSSLDTALESEVDLSGIEVGSMKLIAADSIIVADEYSVLDRVIIIAPYVRIGDRFKGNVQVFATDSVSIGESVKLDYPSAVVLLHPDTATFQPQLRIGKYSEVRGLLMAWQQERRTLMPVLSLGDSSSVQGEVWSKGYVKLGKGVQVRGGLSAIRLMANHASILYENYLIDVRLDATARSKYYLSSQLMQLGVRKRKILCWLK